MTACVLSGRNGWWDGNYEPDVGAIEWLKPAKWFAGPSDTDGKLAEWNAYMADALASRSPRNAGTAGQLEHPSCTTTSIETVLGAGGGAAGAGASGAKPQPLPQASSLIFDGR